MFPPAASPSSSPPLRLSRRGAAATEQPISRLMSAALADRSVISLAAGFVDQTTLPIEAVQRIVSRLRDDPEHGQRALQYGTNQGSQELRVAIADRYLQGDAEAHAESMVLTAGSNQLLHHLLQCLCDPGEIVLCAAPTYFVFLGAVEEIGARAWGVATDEQGILPAALDAALSQIVARGEGDRVKALYVVPDCDNPRGASMSQQRRRAVIEVLQRWSDSVSLALLADNAYRDLAEAPPPLFLHLGSPAETTIETGTFSKNFSPGLRVGWGLVPQPLRSAVTRHKAVLDFGSAHFNQQVVLEALRSGELDRHLERVRALYAEKRAAAFRACERFLARFPGVEVTHPHGGIYLWVTLPEAIDTGPDGPLWPAAVERGVLYVPGGFCFPSEGAARQRNCLRLSFSVPSLAAIDAGIERLGDAVGQVLGARGLEPDSPCRESQGSR